MPRPADYDRIRAALETLARLDAIRGAVIQAQDWNALVATVTDLARATLADAEGGAVPPHTHPGEVTIDWLAPPLRALVERGPLADPVHTTRLVALETSLRRLEAARDKDGERAADLRGRLDEVAVRDLERQAQVTRIGRQVDQVLDPRDELADMRKSLGSVQGGMNRVLEAAARLSQNGEVVDLAALRGRVGELEQLRERLQAASGELLDAKAIESRIAAIAESAVSQEELREALEEVRDRPGADLAQLETRLSAKLRADFADQLKGLSADLDGRVDQRLAGLDQLVENRVGSAVPAAETRLNSRLEERLGTVLEESGKRAAEISEERVRTRVEALNRTIAEQLKAQDAAIAAQVRAEVAARNTADLARLQASLAAAEGRIDEAARALAGLQSARDGDARALAAVPQQLATLRAELRTTLVAEAQARADATQAAVDRQLAGLAQAQQDRLATLAMQLNQAATDTARKEAQAATQAELKTARVGILAEVRGIAREEVAIGLKPTRGGTAIDPRIGAGGRIDLDVLQPGADTLRRPGG